MRSAHLTTTEQPPPDMNTSTTQMGTILREHAAPTWKKHLSNTAPISTLLVASVEAFSSEVGRRRAVLTSPRRPYQALSQTLLTTRPKYTPAGERSIDTTVLTITTKLGAAERWLSTKGKTTPAASR